MPRCPAPRKDGKPCTLKPRESGYCFAHDPELRQARLAGSQRGGQNKRTTIRAARLVPEYLKPVLEQLRGAMTDVYSGTIPAQRGIALAQLATSLCRVYELASVDQRLTALEAAKEQSARE